MPRTLELRTRRLLLRSHEESDIPALVRLLGAREVAATTLRIPHPYTEEDARKFLSSISEESMPTRFAVCLEETGELCGGCGLSPDTKHSHAELGYWMGVPFWGNGYCTEAVGELLRYGFEDLGLHRIFAHCFVVNAGSRRVMEKLGMKNEGRLRQHIMKWGEYQDLDNFGMLADDWRATRL